MNIAKVADLVSLWTTKYSRHCDVNVNDIHARDDGVLQKIPVTTEPVLADHELEKQETFADYYANELYKINIGSTTLDNLHAEKITFPI